MTMMATTRRGADSEDFRLKYDTEIATFCNYEKAENMLRRLLTAVVRPLKLLLAVKLAT